MNKYDKLIDRAEKIEDAALIASYKIVRNVCFKIGKTSVNGWSMAEWALRCEIRRRGVATTREELNKIIAA